MPGYRTHLMGGVLAYGFTLWLLKDSCNSLLLAAQWLLFALAGALFPDVDTKSKGQKMLYQILFIILVILALERKFFAMGVISILSLIPLIVRHRGLFHNFWFVLGLPAVVALLLSWYAPTHTRLILLSAVFFTVGGISHLFLDFVVKR